MLNTGQVMVGGGIGGGWDGEEGKGVEVVRVGKKGVGVGVWDGEEGKGVGGVRVGRKGRGWGGVWKGGEGCRGSEGGEEGEGAE